MSPVIRVDDQVYAWLQAKAKPFEDTPNSVLRTLANLDFSAPEAPAGPVAGGQVEAREAQAQEMSREVTPPRNASLGKRLSGKLLARKWKVSVRHALYHKDGTWYNNLREFPGALFDPKGYVLFRTEEEYRRCPQVNIGEETNVRPHISAIRGYVRIEA